MRCLIILVIYQLGQITFGQKLSWNLNQEMLKSENKT